MKNKILLISLLAGAGACQPPADPNSGADAAQSSPVTVHSTGQTNVTVADGANDPAILIDRADPARSLIIGSGAAGGIELYTLDGERVAVIDERPVTLVDVAYDFVLDGDDTDLIIAYDAAAAELIAYRPGEDRASLERISRQTITTEAEIEGLCLYNSPLSGKFYAFAAGNGQIQQWEFYGQGGHVAARKIRDISVGLGAAHCAVNESDGTLYYSQETVGVWKLNAEPESEAEPAVVALAMPHGPFTGDVKGLAMYPFEQGGGVLVVSDADISAFQVFDLSTDEHLGSFSIGASATVGAVNETEGLAIASSALSADYPRGLVVLADDDNDGEHTNYKIVSWDAVASAIKLPNSEGANPTLKGERSAITVSPSVETTPVQSYGDAADDPAIWVHPERPELSLIIGSQKQYGINVYDLDGNLLQSLADGRINNVDVRYGFNLGGKTVDIVTGSNRTSDSISVYRVDPYARTLENVTDGIIDTGMVDPYGLCMYRSAKSGDLFVFVNDTDGIVRQFRLEGRDNNRIGAERVREISVGSQTEGCVADDETGDLYVGEEDVGIWKYSAEPDADDTRSSVDNTESGNLTDDVEGLAIYYGADGAGYLLASNQGADSYAVYERAGDNQFVGIFHVVADEASGIDGASETDGLDVSSANLGPAFPNGVFVVQDGRNITPAERQNFKLVPWERVAAAMGLDIHEGYDPRAAKSD